jgi:hypothetical protein
VPHLVEQPAHVVQLIHRSPTHECHVDSSSKMFSRAALLATHVR